MFKTKRKRAVVLALIAFFCTAAVTYVAVDWKRFGGGFLAFFRGEGGQHVASNGGPAGSGSSHIGDGATNHRDSPSLPQMAAAVAHTKRPAGTGSGHGKSDDDLFVYGNPAAGGIPAGSFIVAQNDTPSGGNTGGVTGPAPGPSSAGEDGSSGSSGGGGGESSPAAAPTTGNGSSGDIGLPGTGKTTPTPSPPPASPPPPPAVTPTPPPPTQSGSTDTPPAPPPPLPPVSAVPEASSLAMMGLGVLFLAVAAQRKRKNG